MLSAFALPRVFSVARLGKKVTIVEMLDAIMQDAVSVNALDIQRRFDGLESDKIKAKVLTGNKAVEITDDGVVVADNTSKKSTLKADSIVLAVGMKPNEDGLAEALRGKVPEVYRIGDCEKIGKVIGAIWTGFRTARLI